jgi:hypothetical protein
MVGVKETWMEKRIMKEEKGDSSSSDESSRGSEGNVVAEVNMVFQLPSKFCLLKSKMSQLALGAERVVFKKPEALGQHMKPLYIKGHLDGRSVNRMLVDRGGDMRQHYAHYSVRTLRPHGR